MEPVQKKQRAAPEAAAGAAASDGADLRNCEGICLLKTLTTKSVDMILTDPPYVISRDSGMNTLADTLETADGAALKTDAQWEVYRGKRTTEEWITYLENNGFSATEFDKKMAEFEKNYLLTGHILGKKYAVKTDYGDWDKQFTMSQLQVFVAEYYRVLKDGGVCVIWFDSWKIESLAAMMKTAGFKQLRHIVWEKTNPQPLNSSRNLLTNGLEFAVLGVKKSKPTFNSKYKTGVLRYPIQGGKQRFHPTQKNVELFKELVELFSNEGDTVLDTFLGSGTTAVAAQALKRRCIGCELNDMYFTKMLQRLAAV